MPWLFFFINSMFLLYIFSAVLLGGDDAVAHHFIYNFAKVTGPMFISFAYATNEVAGKTLLHTFSPSGHDSISHRHVPI